MFTVFSCRGVGAGGGLQSESGLEGGLGAPGLWEIGFSLREMEFGFHFDGRSFISAALQCLVIAVLTSVNKMTYCYFF